MTQPPIIPCELLQETSEMITAYAEALRTAGPSIGTHGLTPQGFWEAGLFHGAIERLRGRQAAYTLLKRNFMVDILNRLQTAGGIDNWEFQGEGERHDYMITMPNSRISVIEAKGCMDGNNTNIFERPPNADEFVIWSLCQNPGADPRHNAWSGIHTRLGAEVIHRQQRVDGVVIWDMLCGTTGRPCPKLTANPERATVVNGRRVPPPCLYLFPRSIPDARNNQTPPCWQLGEVRLLSALWENFNCDSTDVVEVRIEARMKGSNVQRKTRFCREGQEFRSSRWTDLKRARR
jgi:hypothetical protein